MANGADRNLSRVSHTVLRGVDGLQIVVEHASAPIKSVELQLIRVESVAHAEGVARDGAFVYDAAPAALWS